MNGGLTEQAAALAIEGACRELRLPTVRAQHAALAEAAARDRLSHRAFLAEVLAAEVEERDARRRERRIAEARFPRPKRLADFDLAAAATIPPATLAALGTLAWVTAGEPVVLIGDPGTGKSHCETEGPVMSRARTQTGAGSGEHDPKSHWPPGLLGRHDPNESSATRGPGVLLANDMSARPLSAPAWVAEALA